MMEKPSSFEYQILLKSCQLLSVASLVAFFANYGLGIEIEVVIITILFSGLSVLNWFLLKKFNLYKLVRLLTTLQVFILLNFVWYYNYSSQGPTMAFFSLFVLFVTFVWNKRFATLINVLIILNLAFLYYIDLFKHELLLEYPSLNARINDAYFTALIVILLSFLFSYLAKTNYIRKYEEAKRSDDMKTIFLQNMSHELRTPLNAVIGFSEISDKNSSIEEMLEFNKIINSSGKHLLSIVNDLIDVTLIESGETKVFPEVVCLADVLNDVHQIMEIEKQNLKKEDIELSLSLPSNSSEVFIYIDQGKIKQLLINLLKNALKFTNEGIVRYGYHIERKRLKNFLTFFVSDTGIGIEKQNIEKIFDSFWQADLSHTRLYGGTGIGLAISKKLAKLLKGDLWVESEVGKGSTFYFSLPYQQSKSSINPNVFSQIKGLKSNNPKKKPDGQKFILVVEDVEASYEYIQVILQRMGLKAIWAKNGEEAIKLCAKNKNIELVLMDINMPSLNGYEATKEIKRFRPELPVIAQTAYVTNGYREKSLEAGCDDYISKPIKKEALESMIHKFLT